MRRLFGSLAIVFLAAVMTAFGYAQTTGCCQGKCGCGETATCTKSGHCDDACKKGSCCGKECAKSSAAGSCCGGQMAGKDGGSMSAQNMCAQMKDGKAVGASCCHEKH